MFALSVPAALGQTQFFSQQGLMAAPPPNPVSPGATAVSSSAIDVTWTTGGGSTTSFKVAYQSGASAPANCSLGTVLSSAVSPTSVTGLAGSTQYSFRICAVDAASRVSAGVVATVSTSAPPVCVWTGALTTGWAHASNWSGCGGSTPGPTSDVRIPSGTPNAPTVSLSTTVNDILAGAGGGIVTVDPGVTLSIGDSIRSNVTFKGSSTTCTTCVVAAKDTNIWVDAAVLTLDKGITVALGNNGRLGVTSDSGAAGFIASGGATSTEWPKVTASSGSFQDIVVYNSTPSSNVINLNVNGLKVDKGGGPIWIMRIAGYTTVNQFDHVAFTNITNASQFLIFNCVHSPTIVDTSWDDLQFTGTPATNIQVALCNWNPNVQITGSGPKYGVAYEDDTADTIDWN